MRRFARLLICLAVVAAPLVVGAQPAEADQYLCGPSSSYSCLSSTGYAGQSVWGSWGPGHNCVSYAAYRLSQTGGRPWGGTIGNGSDWDEKARSVGIPVDTNPAVGSIAQKDGGAGHVAYVEEVQPTYIVISEDAYITDTSGYSSVRRLERNGAYFASLEFIHVRDVPPANPLAEGNFINLNGNIYRIAGGAPIYVQSWDAVGGPQAYSAVTQAQFDSLRQYPADGTFVAADGFIYIFAGGAPVYLDSWDSVGGYRGQTIWVIDHAAIDAADGPWPWNHIRRYPADGTIVAAGGHIYVFAGGAPLYVNSWDNMGGYQGQTITTIALPALENITASPPWNHVRYYPADGTIVAAGGYIYVFAGGAPLYVNSWDNMGGYQGQTITTVALPALENITASPPWNHVRYYPADGTAVLAGIDAFIFAGGAPIYVGDWSAVGGERTAVRIAAPALDNADGQVPWNHVHQYPADGTELRGGPAGAFYRVLAGVAEPVGSSTSPTVVDQAAIDNAGAGGVWNHLKTPATPVPVDEASVFVTGEITYSVLGPFTSGGFDVTKNGNGTLHSIEGSGTFANGATFSAKASQFWILPIFVGSTRLTDSAAKLDLNTPIFLGKVSVDRSSVFATQGWFDLRTWPWKSYNLRWTVIDY